MTIQPRENGSHRPRVFALNPLRSQALALAHKHFDLVEHDDPENPAWREEAEGLLVVGSHVTTEDVEKLAQGNIRYISKQGTGVDKIDVATAKKHGIPVMNTPGVNVSTVE